jgi:hypothetical protein
MKDERDQLDLFTRPVARARATDPLTSFQAAGAVERTGRAASDRAKCMEVVRKHPGLTSGEIAELAGLERHASARRLPELRSAGMVRNGDARKCRLTGNQSLTWWPTEANS